MHPRSQIRAAAVSTLTGLSSTGDRVYPTRVHPLDAAKLPALLVYTNDETSSLLSAEGDLERNLDLVVEILAMSNVPDDTVDAIALQVEQAMGLDETLGLRRLVQRQYLTASRGTFNGDGERRAGSLRLTFQVTYWCRVGHPEERP